MKMRAVALLVPFLVAATQASAATSFPCAGAHKDDFETVCGDRDLVALDRTITAMFDRLTKAVDPLTAVLLKRDQRWFTDILNGRFLSEFSGTDDPQRQRLITMLQGRLAVLRQIRPGLGEAAPAGKWANALATTAVTRQADGALRVEMSATVSYTDRDEPVTCGLTASVVRGIDDWYAGNADKMVDPSEREDTDAQDSNPKDSDADSKPPVLRLRLQGNTLRVVLTGGQTICDGPNLLTGSYFTVDEASRSSAGNAAARTVAPSFDCATASNFDEEEICADPDLARNDVEIARVWRETLRRLAPALAAHLRSDQKAWLKENVIAFDTYLHPSWDKQAYYIHQTGGARAELERRQNERLAMLNGLDENRQGFVGLWVGHNAIVAIFPAEGKKDGTLTADGGKWETGDYKSHCDISGDGKVERSKLKLSGGAPVFVRDGATLTVDGNDPDPDRDGEINREQPDYCTRMRSAKARLFPVKSDAKIGALLERIR